MKLGFSVTRKRVRKLAVIPSCGLSLQLMIKRKTIFIILLISFIIIIFYFFYDTNFKTKYSRLKADDIVLDDNKWAYEAIGYDAVYSTIAMRDNNLSNIKVAVIDTGVDLSHPDLNQSIIEGYNFVDNTNDPSDDNGHGTLIAGIIGGSNTGIAKGVKIMPVKVLDLSAFGNTENFVKGIYWAVEHKADIINISIARRKLVGDKDTYSEDEYNAINFALKNHVIVVVSAGNFGENVQSYPAAYKFNDEQSNFIVVSAIRSNYTKDLFSSSSDDIDVTAPGENINSTFPKILDVGSMISGYSNIENDGYLICRGTSISAAFVSGLVAVVKSYGIKGNQIKGVIQTTALDVGEPKKDNTFGYGLISVKNCISYINDYREGLFMKKLIAGISIMILALVLFLSVHIQAVRYINTLGSWSTPPGKYMTGISHIGGTGILFLSIILGVFGLVLTLIGVFKK